MITFYASASPESTALIYDDGGLKELSFSELLEKTDKRADELIKGGCSCIGIFTDTTPECVIEIFAAAKAGLQIVLLDENMPDEVLRGQISMTGADILFGDEELCGELIFFFIFWRRGS